MSKTNRIEVLFQELCDEDIACVSGGLLTSMASATASDDPTKTTASVLVTGPNGTQSLSLTSPAVTQPSPTTSSSAIPTLISNLLTSNIISILSKTIVA